MTKRFRVPGRLGERLEELGVGVPAVLRRAGLPQDIFAQPRILVTTQELFALWQAIDELAPDPAIGLHLGSETRSERFQPMVLAALATESFGAAVTQMARYKRLTSPEEIVQERDADEWRIQFRWLLADVVEPRALTDCCFACVLSIGRHGSGTRMSPLRVELVQPRAPIKLMERFFGCPVVCGAPGNTIVFRAADAHCPFVTRNADLLDMLAPQFEQALKQTAGEDEFPQRVRGAIQDRLTGRRPSIHDVARGLHISSRTLQRRLQDSGSSYQRVLDEARRQMARYYLGNSELEVSEAAYLLGYEDANSFVRAFRMWEGMPPGHWRERHRAGRQAPQPGIDPGHRPEA